MGIFTPIPYELRRRSNKKTVQFLKRLNVIIIISILFMIVSGLFGFMYLASLFFMITIVFISYKSVKFALLPFPEGE